MRAADPPARCDVAVVGAGIVGLAVARELTLRHPGLRVCVLEREGRVAAHQSGNSSGVIHAGIPYEPGSLKARLCLAGARALFAYGAERGVPARRDGQLIVATRERELPALTELERRGRANGVEGLRRLAGDEIPEVEPHVRGLAALHSPGTGTVDFRLVCEALAADVRAAGGTVALGCEVRSLAEEPGGLRVVHSRGTTRARALIACAGAWADRLARAAGAPDDVRIAPFRGAYLRMRTERAGLVRGHVYPVPDARLPFLGAHLTRRADGAVLLGPTALLAGARDAYRLTRMRPGELRETLAWPGTRRLARRHPRAAARELAHAALPALLVREARRMVPGLRRADFARGPAGVRAQALARDGTLLDDFLIWRGERSVHVRNAPSPAATAALPLARLIADELPPLERG